MGLRWASLQPLRLAPLNVTSRLPFNIRPSSMPIWPMKYRKASFTSISCSRLAFSTIHLQLSSILSGMDPTWCPISFTTWMISSAWALLILYSVLTISTLP